MLPELHGFDIARRIKVSWHGRIPIIMVSAVYPWLAHRARISKESYGIEEYLEKPFRILRRAGGRPTPA